MPSAGQPGKATQQVLNSLHAVYPARPDSSDAHSERSGMMRQSTVCVCVCVCVYQDSSEVYQDSLEVLEL